MPKIFSTVFIVVVVVVDVRPVLRPLPDGVHEDVERADAVIGVAHLANVVAVGDVGDDKSFFLNQGCQTQVLRIFLPPQKMITECKIRGPDG